MTSRAEEACDLIVVGAGPSGLRALLELEAALEREAIGRELRIIVLDPSTAGAGAIWNPEQPMHLRLNVDASMIDFSGAHFRHDFNDWNRSGERFVSRARVGQYLALAFQRLVAGSAHAMRHVRAQAHSALRGAHGWTIRAQGSDGTEMSFTAPEVLLCTGHAPRSLPDHRFLAESGSFGPGNVVFVKGASLSAFDVVGSLTEGRGGVFEGPAHDRYSRSGNEPERIVVWSRSGANMLPKPEVEKPEVATAVKDCSKRLLQWSSPVEAWWKVLEDAAVAGAAAAGVRLNRAALRAVWDHPLVTFEPWHAASGQNGTLLTRWKADLRRAYGQIDDDPYWWWGRAWSLGYEQIIRSLDRAPRAEATWTQWRRRAKELERWAFGPPAQSIERLIAVTEAKIVDWRTAPEGEQDAGSMIVEAVTPPPGVASEPVPWNHQDANIDASAPRSVDPLWVGLLEEGHVVVRPGERCVYTDLEARCINAQGQATAGLSALGRPTEDPIIGHDSLKRDLHPEPKRWAASFARRNTSCSAQRTQQNGVAS